MSSPSFRDSDFIELSIYEFVDGVNSLFYTPRDGVAILVRKDVSGDIIETFAVDDWWLFCQPNWSEGWSCVHWYEG